MYRSLNESFYVGNLKILFRVGFVWLPKVNTSKNLPVFLFNRHHICHQDGMHLLYEARIHQFVDFGRTLATNSGTCILRLFHLTHIWSIRCITIIVSKSGISDYIRTNTSKLCFKGHFLDDEGESRVLVYPEVDLLKLVEGYLPPSSNSGGLLPSTTASSFTPSTGLLSFDFGDAFIWPMVIMDTCR